MHRKIFTDGFNSFSHFAFGMASRKFPAIIIAFIGYEYIYRGKSDATPEILEFLLGYVSVSAANQLGWIPPPQSIPATIVAPN
jgi:hypothetical protein